MLIRINYTSSSFIKFLHSVAVPRVIFGAHFISFTKNEKFVNKIMKMSFQEETILSTEIEIEEVKVEEVCPFDPIAYNLDENFRLTRFSEVKGRAGKLPEGFLSKVTTLLHEQNVDDEEEENMGKFSDLLPSSLGIGMECSITPLRHGSLCLAQTIDFFYPIVDDPVVAGKIACAKVLSDLYALGICECDNLMLLMAVSIKMSDKERDIIVPLLIKGFKEKALEAHARLSFGQTALNPWCIIGGAASSICQTNEYIVQDNAIPGDVIVLTKALGTQVACHIYQSLDAPERWNRIKHLINEEEVRRAYERAINSMVRLNLKGARLMHKYNAHCSTDITSNGLLGHAQILASRQKRDVSFVIHNLPIIAKMAATSKACGNLFQLLQGHAPEVSGGLLICFPREQAAAFCKDIEKQDGCQAWIIGLVERGNKTARIIEKPRVIEVPPPFKF